MKKKIVLSFYILMFFSIHSYSQTLYNMNHGEIYIGVFIKTDNHRLYINRAGIQVEVPIWWIKRMEDNVSILPIKSTDLILSNHNKPELNEKIIQITSQKPIIHSHFELYPPRNHYWRQTGTYLRGYLVNNSNESFQRMHIQFTFYQKDDQIAYQLETDIFKVYGKTMKPFIIDTQTIDWRVVTRISITPISTVEMKK